MPTLAPGDDPAAFVRARLDEGADYLKIFHEDASVIGGSLPTLTAGQITALVAAAHAAGVRAVVHVSTAVGAQLAAAAEADLLAHVPVEPLEQQAVDALLRHGVGVIATLAVYAASSCTGDAAALAADERIARRLTPDHRSALRTPAPACFPSMLPNALADVGRLHAAGVPILAGTDAGNSGTTHGASLHGELELLVRAGLGPVQALAAATSLPAQRFGLDDRGAIVAGRRADLLLVDGDPTTTVTDTRNTATVWKNGYAVTS